MSYKKLIPFINGENELAANVVTMAEDYCFAVEFQKSGK